MLLAARALGLGSTLTTRHIGYAKECEDQVQHTQQCAAPTLPI
jgi:hypothetical protein